MLAVGLGKQKGAERVHAEGMDRTIAKAAISKAKILCAVACIENAYDETAYIEAVDTKDILTREPELLKLGLLVKECDVLIVDETGKNYSRTGRDGRS